MILDKTETEVWQAINKLKNNPTPGPDSLLGEF